MKSWIKILTGFIKKFSLTDFLFGKVKAYRVTVDGMTYDMGARSYILKKDGYAVLRSGFRKVGTFINAKSVMVI